MSGLLHVHAVRPLNTAKKNKQKPPLLFAYYVYCVCPSMVIYYYHSCKNRIAYIDMYISMHMQKDTPKKSSQPFLLCHIFLSFQPVSFPASLIADFKSTSASSRALIERCAHFRPVHCIARETSSKRLPRKRIKPCCNSKHVTLELDILADRK